MRLKVILTSLVLFLLALVAIAFTIVQATDFNQYRDYVSQRMKAATGRDLVIAGDVDVGFSLTPRLTARQVSFRNAAWSDQPQMASLGEVEAQIDLIAILFGEIRLKDVVLRGGQVVVETNKDGVGNWVLDLPSAPTPAPADSATTAGGLPRVDHLIIEDVTLLYRDGAAGTQQTLKIAKFVAEDAPGVGLKVSIAGSWNDRPLSLAGTTGTPRQFTEGPLPLDLKGELGAVSLELRGRIGDPTTFTDLALDITTAGPSMKDLGDILGITLPASKPYSLTGRLTGGEGKYSADRLSAKVGGSDATGLITVDAAAEVTHITGTLASDRLDFADLGLDESDSPPPGDGRLFSAEPWPMEWLNEVDGEFTWKVGTLLRGGAGAQDVTVAVTMEDGNLNLNNLRAQIEGGTVAATGALKSVQDGAALAIKLNADGIQSAPLLHMMGLQDVLTVGRVDIVLDVNGPAASLRDLMAGLNGTASFATGSGSVRNSFARLLLANLFGLMTPGGQDAPITCTAGRFDIRKGIATTRGTVVDTPSAIVVGAGNIDLRNERIDMRVDPKSRDVSLAAIAVPIRISGPLASPSVSPDPVATVGNTVDFATGTVNVATLGIFGALTGVGEGNPGTNSCAGALGAALKKEQPSSATDKILKGVGDAADGVGEGTKDLLQGVGDGINNLFGN
ncbi:MAG TPA: AsmA family protein [Dongiaceae bacterium]|nr:AsmA family protein [Dongiaceae bacterium]